MPNIGSWSHILRFSNLPNTTLKLFNIPHGSTNIYFYEHQNLSRGMCTCIRNSFHQAMFCNSTLWSLDNWYQWGKNGQYCYTSGWKTSGALVHLICWRPSASLNRPSSNHCTTPISCADASASASQKRNVLSSELSLRTGKLFAKEATLACTRCLHLTISRLLLNKVTWHGWWYSVPLEDTGCGEPCVLVLEDDDPLVVQIKSQVFFGAAFNEAT
jgi:hypothetical protein